MTYFSKNRSSTSSAPLATETRTGDFFFSSYVYAFWRKRYASLTFLFLSFSFVIYYLMSLTSLCIYNIWMSYSFKLLKYYFLKVLTSSVRCIGTLFEVSVKVSSSLLCFVDLATCSASTLSSTIGCSFDILLALLKLSLRLASAYNFLAASGSAFCFKCSSSIGGNDAAFLMRLVFCSILTSICSSSGVYCNYAFFVTLLESRRIGRAFLLMLSLLVTGTELLCSDEPIVADISCKICASFRLFSYSSSAGLSLLNLEADGAG